MFSLRISFELLCMKVEVQLEFFSFSYNRQYLSLYRKQITREYLITKVERCERSPDKGLSSYNVVNALINVNLS
jgi:hypothetical protein